MSAVKPTSDLPEQFEDIASFGNWVRESFPLDSDTSSKGRGWRDFLCELLPLTEIGRAFPKPAPSLKESNDDGVDALSEPNDAGQVLVLQAKLGVPGKEQLDSVLSKWRNYESKLIPAAGDKLFALDEAPDPPPYYVLACTNSLDKITRAYEATQLGSRAFYDRLVAEKRLAILDGVALLDDLRRVWRMQFSVPSLMELRSPNGWLRTGDVSVGLISGGDLATLARVHGLGLFFENVRDFLGLAKNTDRTTVNRAIQATARDDPSKMLARNNGIVFRASAVEPQEDDTRLRLEEASIVNGCQTTMCLAELETPVADDCQVVVKVVQASDAWEVAEAANNQNSISQIDLKLARFLRKQVAQKAAATAGFTLTNHTDPEGLSRAISALRQREVNYDALRYLFLALFSSKPNYLWDDNYSRLLTPVLDSLYATDAEEQQGLFETLFQLLLATQDALALCQQINQDDDPLRRAHDPGRPKYRVYLAVLALCATFNDNLAERSDNDAVEADRMRAFIGRIRGQMEDPARRKIFTKSFIQAYSLLGELVLEEHEDDAKGKVAQRAQSRVSSASFTALHQKLRRRIETDRISSSLT